MTEAAAPFSVELAREHDLPRICQIESSSPIPWSDGLLAQELSNPASRTLVARSPGAGGGGASEMVGYVCRSVVADEIHVLRLAVDPQKRRRGIGRFLLDAVIREALETGDVRAVVLEVAATNEPAEALYRSAGFHRVGLRRDYYGRGEHALVMVLRTANDER